MTDEIEDNLISRTSEHLRKDEDVEALKTAESLERYKHEDAIALYMKGIALYENKKFDDALRYLSEAATIKKDEKRVWYGIGYTLIALNRITEANDALKYVVSVDREHTGGHMGLFIINIIEKNKEQAFYHLQKASENKEITRHILEDLHKNLIKDSKIDDSLKNEIYNYIKEY